MGYCLQGPPPPPPAPTSLYEIAELNFLEKKNTFAAGAGQFITNRPVCLVNSIGLLVGCAPQFTTLSLNFGFPLFSPGITVEDQTPEYFATLPPVLHACCVAADLFHSALCACDTQTIEAFRNFLLFDPEVTEPAAHFIYGQQCGVNVVTGDQCPNGNPFDRIRAMAGRKMRKSA